MTTIESYWEDAINNEGKQKVLFLQPIPLKIIPFLLLATLTLFAIRYSLLHYYFQADDVPQELLKRAQQTPKWILAILIPCLEEILFRWLLQGMILHHLLLRGKSAWLAILLSGIIFGLAHQYFLMIIAATLMGVFIAWIFWRYKSLYAAIFVHVLNNLLVIALS